MQARPCRLRAALAVVSRDGRLRRKHDQSDLWSKHGNQTQTKLQNLTHTTRPPKVNHFAEYLQQRWDEGCHNAAQLYREIREKGYAGKRAMVARLVATWRKGGKNSRPKAPERISPKHASILVTRAVDQMTEVQQRLFDRISAQCPDVIELRQMALAFRAALTGGDAANLRLWVEGARRCEYGPVVRFAYGLRNLLAVSAAVETSWSTG